MRTNRPQLDALLTTVSADSMPRIFFETPRLADDPDTRGTRSRTGTHDDRLPFRRGGYLVNRSGLIVLVMQVGKHNYNGGLCGVTDDRAMGA